MKNSKRSQNQKKKQSKQRGGRPPKIEEQPFNVYYNYRLHRDINFDGSHGKKLTRQLDARELNICQEWMTLMRNAIIEHGGAQYAALEVGDVTQLQQPRDNFFHFKIVISVKNKTQEEATELLNKYMQLVSTSGFIEFDGEIYKVSIGYLPSEAAAAAPALARAATMEER
jgi:hypothetical protein